VIERIGKRCAKVYSARGQYALDFRFDLSGITLFITSIVIGRASFLSPLIETDGNGMVSPKTSPLPLATGAQTEPISLKRSASIIGHYTPLYQFLKD
jgi:hypothetical protein